MSEIGNNEYDAKSDRDAGDPSRQPDLTFPKALSFMYQEYVSFNGERDLWTLEKSEYEARISHLEGEVDSLRILNRDLLNRIKMLEFALKRERKLLNGETEPPLLSDSEMETNENVNAIIESFPRKKARDILRGYIMEVTKSENFIQIQNQMSNLRKPIKSFFTLYPNERQASGSDEMYEETSVNATAITGENYESPNYQVRRYVEIYRNEIRPKRLLEKQARKAPISSVEMGEQELQSSVDNKLFVADSMDTNDPSSNSPIADVMSSFEFLSKYTEDDCEDESGTTQPTPQTEIKDQEKLIQPKSFLSKHSHKNGVEKSGAGSDSKMNASNGAEISSTETFSQPSKEYKVIFHSRCHVDSVRCIAFDLSETSTIFATGSDDSVISMWNAKMESTSKTTKPLILLRGHSEPVLSMCFLPIIQDNNKYSICSSSMDGSLMFWSVDLGTSNYYPNLKDMFYDSEKLNLHQDAIWSISSVYDSSQTHRAKLLSLSSDGLAAIWSGFEDGNVTSDSAFVCASADLQVGPSSAQFCRYSPDTFVFALDDDLTFCATHDFSEIINIHLSNEDYPSAKSITCLSTHPTDQNVLVGWDEKLIQVVDPRVNRSVRDISVYNSIVSSLSYNVDGSKFASAHSDGYLNIWDCRNYRPFQNIKAHNVKYDDGTIAVSYHSRLDMLGTGGADDTAKIFA